MSLWMSKLSKFEKDENMYLLVLEADDKVVASVQMAIIESLTHNVMSVCFGYCEASWLNGILAMSESDYKDAMKKYASFL